ncbi:hypothetical protein DFO66_103324 [Brevibacterium sanguinis]|uniref:Uncharacterized protein n=2 Tax=Brevibacterium TaxID=1696 RepID=A0A366ILD0_9MICO|nr:MULTISPECIES: hypothetical protein [Brevibacterium]RBP66377.1 hypothetical protein DFO66_103324 [Brevibacterium sanguinis]RBP73028.1 hypothetical protein DFO65_103323 [Brevibacterium celere]
MVNTRKSIPQFDVKDLHNGTAQFVINQGAIEVEVRLDADQVDDLQAALEAVGHSMEDWHREQERSEYADMQNLRRQ